MRPGHPGNKNKLYLSSYAENDNFFFFYSPSPIYIWDDDDIEAGVVKTKGRFEETSLYRPSPVTRRVRPSSVEK